MMRLDTPSLSMRLGKPMGYSRGRVIKQEKKMKQEFDFIIGRNFLFFLCV